MISLSNKIKVLIVDDEVDVLEFLKYNLEREGYEVQTAHNGLEAIDAAKKIYSRLDYSRRYDASNGWDRSLS